MVLGMFWSLLYISSIQVSVEILLSKYLGSPQYSNTYAAKYPKNSKYLSSSADPDKTRALDKRSILMIIEG